MGYSTLSPPHHGFLGLSPYEQSKTCAEKGAVSRAAKPHMIVCGCLCLVHVGTEKKKNIFSSTF